MDAGSLLVRCACGWETRGTEDEIVEATREHGRRVHNMLPSRAEVVTMVVGPDRPGGTTDPEQSTAQA